MTDQLRATIARCAEQQHFLQFNQFSNEEADDLGRLVERLTSAAAKATRDLPCTTRFPGHR
jgi:uncharacterized protein (UPF0303 family)